MIVTGDMSQIDLPHNVTSGLVQSQRILRGIPGIAMIEFDRRDIVRHRLVQRIVEAYDKFDATRREESPTPQPGFEDQRALR
jgi:phosphate starvation-inducible PhoH-like protein